METTLLTTGIACLIAAIIGGGLKAFGIEIPLLKSISRQVALGAFGAILLALSFLETPAKLYRSQPANTIEPSSTTQPPPGPVASPSDSAYGSRTEVLNSAELREYFRNYYLAGDDDIKHLIVLLIRGQLEELAVSNGYSAEHIENAEIKELERIAKELKVLR